MSEKDETPHESQDLEDYEVLDASDTLIGEPGSYDPLDSGVAPPERWTGEIRSGGQQSESLDERLAEEEPDVTLDALEDEEEGEEDGDTEEDEDAGDEDVDGLLLDDGPDPRAGRLVAPDEGSHPVYVTDLLASDVGISGGAASAEEAAMHIVEEDDYDIRSEDDDSEDEDDEDDDEDEDDSDS
jgi:Family of unknown function (DUF5709)